MQVVSSCSIPRCRAGLGKETAAALGQGETTRRISAVRHSVSRVEENAVRRESRVDSCLRIFARSLIQICVLNAFRYCFPGRFDRRVAGFANGQGQGHQSPEASYRETAVITAEGRCPRAARASVHESSQPRIRKRGDAVPYHAVSRRRHGWNGDDERNDDVVSERTQGVGWRCNVSSLISLRHNRWRRRQHVSPNITCHHAIPTHKVEIFSKWVAKRS